MTRPEKLHQLRFQDWSTEGMLIFMGRASHAKQLIEVNTPRSGWGRTVNVFETRWAKPELKVDFLSKRRFSC